MTKLHFTADQLNRLLIHAYMHAQSLLGIAPKKAVKILRFTKRQSCNIYF